MSNEVTQRDNTRNQSTADYSHKHFFLFNNKYQEAVLENNAGAAATVKPYTLVARDADNDGHVNAITAIAEVPNVIGILATECDLELADAETANVNYATGGTVAEELIELPAGVTLDTVQGGFSVRDYLNKIGFHLEASSENTKFDN